MRDLPPAAALQRRLSPRGTLAAALLLALAGSPAALALDTVTLQLKWSHGFQFAGYYAARELGYYRDAGLDVRIDEGSPGVDVVEKVVRGRANFGVGTSSLLLARRDGQPVVVLAVIFQHSSAVLITPDLGPEAGLKDLAGKRVMIEPHADELLAMLARSGVPPGSVVRVAHTFGIGDLVAGRVDAMSAYSTSQPFFLDRAGFRYRVAAPLAAGIDFYGDNLFTSEREVNDRPDRVRAFRAATLRGWQHAMANPKEVVDLILAKYQKRYSREFLLFEAEQMYSLLRPDLVEVGYMSAFRWRHVADAYADLGMLPRAFPLDGFLYKPRAPLDLARLWPFLGGALGLALAAAAVAVYIFRVNRRLRQILGESSRTRKALAESERRHRLLADNSTDVIWTTDFEGRFTYVSPSVEALRGYTADEAMRQTMYESLTPDSAATARGAMSRAVEVFRSGQPVPPFRADLEQPCKDGSTIWVEMTVSPMYDAAGKIIGILGVTRDVSQRRKSQETLRHMAQHDGLTGLPNRALFSDRMDLALAAARRDGSRLALMFVDLDRFKAVNDTFGHAVGDLVLQETARRLETCVRASDSAGRIGGDEFVVLLRSVGGAPDALAVGEKILRAIEEPFEAQGRSVGISCSIGVAIYPEDGDGAIELSRSADAAMYAAKEGGRGRVVAFRPPRALPATS